jgi:hypothetical protein
MSWLSRVLRHSKSRQDDLNGVTPWSNNSKQEAPCRVYRVYRVTPQDYRYSCTCAPVNRPTTCMTYMFAGNNTSTHPHHQVPPAVWVGFRQACFHVPPCTRTPYYRPNLDRSSITKAYPSSPPGPTRRVTHPFTDPGSATDTALSSCKTTIRTSTTKSHQPSGYASGMLHITLLHSPGIAFIVSNARKSARTVIVRL